MFLYKYKVMNEDIKNKNLLLKNKNNLKQKMVIIKKYSEHTRVYKLFSFLYK